MFFDVFFAIDAYVFFHAIIITLHIICYICAMPAAAAAMLMHDAAYAMRRAPPAVARCRAYVDAAFRRARCCCRYHLIFRFHFRQRFDAAIIFAFIFAISLPPLITPAVDIFERHAA